jgi:hypothetical protein
MNNAEHLEQLEHFNSFVYECEQRRASYGYNELPKSFIQDVIEGNGWRDEKLLIVSLCNGKLVKGLSFYQFTPVIIMPIIDKYLSLANDEWKLELAVR